MRGLALFACLAAAAAVAAAPAGAQLRTGIVDPQHFDLTPKRAFEQSKAVGAKVVRIPLYWSHVAPSPLAPGSDPTDPANPGYDWDHYDHRIKLARGLGLDVIVGIASAPGWAEGPGRPSLSEAPAGTWKPDAAALGQFARAAATRYGGRWPEGPGAKLPRVRLWQVWNEPNRALYLTPQFEGTTVRSALHYRTLVNAVADGVRAVDGDNLVIAGGLAPLSASRDGVVTAPSPMRFMRVLLEQRTKFDRWSHHPYTSGGPTHKAAGTGNVALGNLPTMRKFLNESVRAGKVGTSRRVQFWVTEFSWDTKPPDPQALPMKLHARWTSEALYRMWRQKITLVTWFKIQDDPMSGALGTHHQSGFYFTNGTRKASFRAFRFPFVAFRQPGFVQLWGRTPTSTPGKVLVQVRVGGRWRTVTTLRASAAGIFVKRVKTPYRQGAMRAVFRTQKSLPFSLDPVANRWVNPFGCGGTIPC